MVDDYGNGVYRCFYTGELIWCDAATIVGSPLPNVKVRHIIAKTSNEHHRQSVNAFHEYEANCNMCRHLVRLPHPKRHEMKFGTRTISLAHPLLGKCNKTGEPLEIWPEDPMHKPCWESRHAA